MTEFRAGWILEVFARNQIMLIALATVLHVRLWTNKSQGYQYKWSPNWMGKSKKFLWNDQVRDNVFWSVVSGGTIWTGFEVLMLWAYANGIIPFIDPREQTLWFVLILVLVPLWRDFHFYWAHRLLHIRILYKMAHYVHHKNIDIGPWSGLSMHPIEHLLYYTCMLIHWVVASHPIHMIMNGQHATFAAILGHGGFDEFVIKDGVKVQSGRFLLPLAASPLFRVQLRRDGHALRSLVRHQPRWHARSPRAHAGAQAGHARELGRGGKRHS